MIRVSHLVRTVLIALLALVMPLKGMAAAGVMPCALFGPPSPGHTVSASHAHTGVLPAVHAADDAAGAHHAHHGHHDHHDQHDHHTVVGSASGDEPSHDPTACKHCAPCAAATAPPAAMVDLPRADTGDTRPPGASADWRAVVIPLPERPPRT